MPPGRMTGASLWHTRAMSAREGAVIVSGLGVVDDVRARARAGRAWARRLTEELALFPETLRLLREGAANFELVGKRLEVASTSLEEVTELYQTTMASSARRSVEMAGALRSQLDALTAAGSPERVSSTLADVQRTFESLAELNPLWPKSSRSSKPKKR